MSLRNLIDDVERGDIEDGTLHATFDVVHWASVEDAFKGSLDAAKCLHDALLPGWGWETGANATFASIAQVWKSGRDKAHVATSETPARAFLLAILRALEQEGRP